MSLLDAADEVDLLQRRARGIGRVGGLERGPELRPHHAFAQPRNVGVRALMNPIQIIGDDVASCRPIDPDDPGEIIVPIDQRRAPQHIPCHRERIVHRCGIGRSLRRPHSTGTATKRTSPSPLETSNNAGFFASVFALSIALAISPGCSTA